jgi:hypothetical protein
MSSITTPRRILAATDLSEPAAEVVRLAHARGSVAERVVRYPSCPVLVACRTGRSWTRAGAGPMSRRGRSPDIEGCVG